MPIMPPAAPHVVSFTSMLKAALIMTIECDPSNIPGILSSLLYHAERRHGAARHPEIRAIQSWRLCA